MNAETNIEVFPVVHVVDKEQAREQARLALDLGADGVYLIAHGMDTGADQLTEIFNEVVEDNPDAFIGVNYLDLGSEEEMLRYLESAQRRGDINRLPDAVWADTIGFDPDSMENLELLRNRLPTIQTLGGVAFKYTKEYTDDPIEAADEVRRNSALVDVVTTSGQGTGSAPSVEKIRAMKEAAGDQPLAVASGIDASNIDSFRGIVDKILVASSVETMPYSGIFDPDKLSELINLAHAEPDATSNKSDF